jgi:hypothetical protein
MHRNCHLDRAFSLLPRRRLGRMNAADRPTNGVVDSQTSDVGSIPIARSISPVDAVGFTGFPPRNQPLKPAILDAVGREYRCGKRIGHGVFTLSVASSSLSNISICRSRILYLLFANSERILVPCT